MADKDKVIDIASKKSVAAIEAEKEEWKKQEQEEFKFRVQVLLDQYQDMLDDGKLQSISITGVTEGGVVSPRAIYTNTETLHKLQFALREAEVGLHEYIADCYGLRDYEYEE